MTGRPLLASVVQVRGSIPLYWSQSATGLNVKPEIQLQHFDPLYEATGLHFEDLSSRYGDPVVVLNLIKKKERAPRESLLGAEFKRAATLLNSRRPAERALDYVAWDFSAVSKGKGLKYLFPEVKPILEHAYNATGLFVYNPRGRADDAMPWEASSLSESAGEEVPADAEGVRVRLQRGLLRANCIDCLDRTNVAQCIFGLLVLGVQLRELDLSDTDVVDPDSSMAMELMAMCAPAMATTLCLHKQTAEQRQCRQDSAIALSLLSRTALFERSHKLRVVQGKCMCMHTPRRHQSAFSASAHAWAAARRYERMGDVLAFQYGGSEAHNRFFQHQRGNWAAAMQSRDLVTSLRRFYSNKVTDAEKQHAMNLFLGNFVPEAGKPALWELESDTYLHAGVHHV
jgi:phosphatidylinositol 3,5-bisphosphate 5-phosphatase